MKRTVFLSALLLIFGGLAYGNTFPDWFIRFRDAVYAQTLSFREVSILYNESVYKTEALYSGRELLIMQSRNEYLLGRAYQNDGQKDEAFARYERGMDFAERSLAIEPSAEGWRMLAENLAFACDVRPFSFTMLNGPRIERYARNALQIDSRNVPSLYMLAARFIYAPAPFHNFPRGIQMMESILNENSDIMQTNEFFNVYYSIGFANYRQRRFEEAQDWLGKALEIFPQNRNALDAMQRVRDRR